jgi:hypothetical protein
MERKMRTKFIFLLGFLFFSNILSADSAFWGNLKSGKHGVGFQILEQYDYGRPYKRKKDYEGNLISGERGRPLQISIWYPAKAGQSASMTLADFVHLTAMEDLSDLSQEGKTESEKRFLQGRWFQGVPEQNVRELLGKSTASFRDAAHADGRFPLIVLANSSSLSSPFSHFLLAEYLASNGFIVASAPARGAQSVTLSSRESFVQMQDLQLVIGTLHDYPSLDRDKLALIGFGLGGLSTALLAMHNSDVDAMVSLDSFLANRFGYSLIFQNSAYKPNQLTAPVLHITSQETNEDTDYAFFKATRFAPAQYVKLKGLTPPDFSSIGMLKSMVPLPKPEKGQLPNTKLGYETIVQYIDHFLKATLHQDSASKTFLQASNASPDLVAVEWKKAIKTPPTEEQFIEIVRQKGAQKAMEIQKEFAQLISDFRIYDPDVLFPIAAEYAEADKIDQAVGVLGLCTDAFPDYWECYDLIGRIHMKGGNKQHAIENLSKSVELNPDNAETVEMLKKLKES